ncbi:hypothetical protein [Salinibacter ruber]|uniref:hypothetical protein n=1 Tax=Salinibacter ruber TaxID=146919 RepID=UPI0021696D44|nr:hypothetical protein [Salinibacter ruber]MCS4119579.1 hypothetical protein [Salinibacter ruber]
MNNKNKVYFFFVSLCVLSIFNGVRDPWNNTFGSEGAYTRWYFNYDYGFTKRGLVGELASLVDPHLSILDIQITYLFFVAIFSVLILLFYFLFLNDLTQYETVLFMAWGVTSVGGIQQYFYDIGRFDVFGAILIFLGTYIMVNIKGKIVNFFVCLVLSFLSILIHEAYFLWVFPALLFVFCFVEKEIINCYTAGLVLCCAAFTSFVSSSSPDTFTSALSHSKELQSISPFEISTQRIKPLYRTLEESILYNVENLSFFRDTFDTILVSSTFLLVLYPYFSFLRILHTIEDTKNFYIYLLLIVCSLAPISLYIAGYDHGRWWGMATVSWSVLFAVVLEGPNGTRIRHQLRENAHLLGLGVVANLVFGPAGVTSLFPKSYAYRIVESIQSVLIG